MLDDWIGLSEQKRVKLSERQGLQVKYGAQIINPKNKQHRRRRFKLARRALLCLEFGICDLEFPDKPT